MNIQLYDSLMIKLGCDYYKRLPNNQSSVLQKGRDKFIEANFNEQIDLLKNCISLAKSGRAGGCDLKLIGGSNKSGVVYMAATLSAKNYAEICIIDYSPAGLHMNKSINLLELLK